MGCITEGTCGKVAELSLIKVSMANSKADERLPFNPKAHMCVGGLVSYCRRKGDFKRV